MPARTHAQFLANVAASLDTALYVARVMVLKGSDVSISGMKFAPTHEQWAEAADGGYDIVIAGKTVNVKQSTYTFGSVKEFADQFPGWERPILVKAVHAKDADLYMILNNARTGAMVISARSKEHWGVRPEVYDKRYDTTQDCYDIAAKHVSWRRLG